MTVVVRPLQATDADQLFVLLAQLTDAPPLPRQVFDEAVAERERACVVTLIVQDVEEGTLVATASLVLERKLTRGGATVGHIEDVVTCAGHRGKGYARLLLERLAEIARARGAYKVILDCKVENTGLYEKVGFATTGEVQMRWNP